MLCRVSIARGNATAALMEPSETYRDGFKIAEVDLEIRGPGDFFGRRQSGLPELQIANLVTDSEILMSARDDANRIIRDDPQLRKPGHGNLKHHLATYLRGAIDLFRAG